MTADLPLPTAEHDELMHSIPLLLSGSLAAADRDRVHAHLLTCEECRMVLAEMSVMPGLIGLLRPSTDEIAPPRARPAEALRAGLVDEVARRRRRSTIRGTALAALASAAVIAFIISLGAIPGIGPAASREPVLLAMAPVAATGDVTGEVAAVDKSWGSAVTVRVDGAAAGTRLKLVAIGDDGRSEAIAWWSVGEDAATVTCEGSSSYRRESLSALQVQTEDGQPLLTSSV